MLKSGCLEPVHHPTSNCSRAFFVQENTKDGTIKARLVTDLRNVSSNTKRVGTPLDGSSHILKRLQHDETMFCSVDMSSGYHQVVCTVIIQINKIFTNKELKNHLFKPIN